jgi:hypothetical protein
MLGRLRMSVEECITAYIELSSRVFQKKHVTPVTIRGKVKARYSTKELQRAIEDVVEAQHLSRDALLKDTSPKACKVFVLEIRNMFAADGSQVRVRYQQGRFTSFPLAKLSAHPRITRPLPCC